MVDTNKLRQAVINFAFYSRPSNCNDNHPATVRDINKLIDKTAIVLKQFIDELEKEA